jgi:UDP-GlcNAc:undecaprenyl-phosphate GlcNAc-1-phosphate transferase
VLTATPLVAAALAFSLALGLTPLVERFARRLGHRAAGVETDPRALPRLGGIAIALGFYAPILAVATRSNVFSSEIYAEPRRVAVFLGGGVVVLALGVYDDLAGARAWQKLAVQIPLAALAWWSGLRVGAAWSFDLSTGLSFATTILWIVVAINAVNLIDGLDGLAAGVALTCLAAVAVSAWRRESPMLMLSSLTLAAAVAGFLVHNFHPARIFMGDTGSMFLGWILATSTVWASQKTATAVGVLLPAVTLGLPLLDTTFAIGRRLRGRQPILRGDQDHLHHRLMARGLSHRGAVVMLYGVSALFASLSIALIFVGDSALHWPILAASLAGALVFALWVYRR